MAAEPHRDKPIVVDTNVLLLLLALEFGRRKSREATALWRSAVRDRLLPGEVHKRLRDKSLEALRRYTEPDRIQICATNFALAEVKVHRWTGRHFIGAYLGVEIVHEWHESKRLRILDVSLADVLGFEPERRLIDLLGFADVSLLIAALQQKTPILTEDGGLGRQAEALGIESLNMEALELL